MTIGPEPITSIVCRSSRRGTVRSFVLIVQRVLERAVVDRPIKSLNSAKR